MLPAVKVASYVQRNSFSIKYQIYLFNYKLKQRVSNVWWSQDQVKIYYGLMLSLIYCVIWSQLMKYIHIIELLSAHGVFWHTQFVLYCGLLPQLKEIFGYEEISFETIKWLQFVITIKKIYARFGIFIVYTRDRGQMAYFRENIRTHVAPPKFHDN